MRAAVVVFPGSNAEVEMVRALRDIVGIQTEIVWHKQTELPAGTDLVAVPGGFSYGDYLRCGAIAKAGAIVPAILRHAERGGLVLGVCNGFQVLTEIGLLPGALVRNQHLRFECRDLFVRVESEGPFTFGYSGVLSLPVAHAEGRYHADAATLESLEKDQRVAFRYCARDGEPAPEANVNGSLRAIAGIYGGPERNVLGLMPHPERASEPFVGGCDGRKLFDSVARWYTERAGRP
jgi:phosphoribosylformylglycinamidine synthase subunit PurQ / glutaminase